MTKLSSRKIPTKERKRWGMLMPQICKYCRQRFRWEHKARYLSHLRHHETWMLPHWFWYGKMKHIHTNTVRALVKPKFIPPTPATPTTEKTVKKNLVIELVDIFGWRNKKTTCPRRLHSDSSPFDPAIGVHLATVRRILNHKSGRIVKPSRVTRSKTCVLDNLNILEQLNQTRERRTIKDDIISIKHATSVPNSGEGIAQATNNQLQSSKQLNEIQLEQMSSAHHQPEKPVTLDKHPDSTRAFVGTGESQHKSGCSGNNFQKSLDDRNQHRKSNSSQASLASVQDHSQKSTTDMMKMPLNFTNIEPQANKTVSRHTPASSKLKSIDPQPSPARTKLKNIAAQPGPASSKLKSINPQPCPARTKLKNIATQPGPASRKLKSIDPQPSPARTKLKNIAAQPGPARSKLKNIAEPHGPASNKQKRTKEHRNPTGSKSNNSAARSSRVSSSSCNQSDQARIELQSLSVNTKLTSLKDPTSLQSSDLAQIEAMTEVQGDDIPPAVSEAIRIKNEGLDANNNIVPKMKPKFSATVNQPPEGPPPRERKKTIYTCSYCPKTFARKLTLTYHEAVHTGNRNFKCQFCDRTFIQPAAKTKHEQSHFGLTKTHKCRYCEDWFASSHSRRVHEMKAHTGVYTYECRSCDATFTSNEEKKAHENAHRNERRHKCSYCEKAFKTLPHKVSHERIHTGEKPYECSVCQKKFTQMAMKQRCERRHTGERYHCRFCEKSYGRKESLVEHERVHQGDTTFMCSFCGKVHGNARSLRLHEMTHSGEKPHKCDWCDKTFIRKEHKRFHEKLHTGLGFYKCRFCSKEFRGKNDHKRHENSHTFEVVYNCNFCGMGFSSTSAQRRHERVHIGIKKHKCEECGKRFETLTHLKRHHQVHTDARPFMCCYCHKTFRSKESVKMHERSVHLKERNYKCSFCPAVFINNVSRYNHECAIHTGEKPYKCSFCDMKFFYRNQKNFHERKVHTGEGLFPCEGCDKKFATKSERLQHSYNKHSDNRPFSCSYCPKGFSTKSALTAHERLHTGDYIFPCDICPDRFTTLGLKNDHKRKYHRDNIDLKCRYCEKRFLTEASKKEHEKKAKGGTPVLCLSCALKYCFEVDFDRHNRKHHKIVEKNSDVKHRVELVVKAELPTGTEDTLKATETVTAEVSGCKRKLKRKESFDDLKSQPNKCHKATEDDSAIKKTKEDEKNREDTLNKKTHTKNSTDSESQLSVDDVIDIIIDKTSSTTGTNISEKIMDSAASKKGCDLKRQDNVKDKSATHSTRRNICRNKTTDNPTTEHVIGANNSEKSDENEIIIISMHEISQKANSHGSSCVVRSTLQTDKRSNLTSDHIKATTTSNSTTEENTKGKCSRNETSSSANSAVAKTQEPIKRVPAKSQKGNDEAEVIVASCRISHTCKLQKNSNDKVISKSIVDPSNQHELVCRSKNGTKSAQNKMITKDTATAEQMNNDEQMEEIVDNEITFVYKNRSDEVPTDAKRASSGPQKMTSGNSTFNHVANKKDITVNKNVLGSNTCTSDAPKRNTNLLQTEMTKETQSMRNVRNSVSKSNQRGQFITASKSHGTPKSRISLRSPKPVSISDSSQATPSENVKKAVQGSSVKQHSNSKRVALKSDEQMKGNVKNPSEALDRNSNVINKQPLSQNKSSHAAERSPTIPFDSSIPFVKNPLSEHWRQHFLF